MKPSRIRVTLCGILMAGLAGALFALPANAGQGPVPNVDQTRAEFLRILDRPKVPPDPSPAQATTANGYAQELLSIAAEANERVPLLILKKGEQPARRAVVIALHGTGGSKEGSRNQLEGYADRGFLAVAMDARFHGARAINAPPLADPYQSALLRAYRTGTGRPYLFDTVWDTLRLIDYLATRPDVDASRIGLIGNSKGGTEAYLAAAADPRVAAVVPLIGVQSFGWSLRRPAAWEARTWTLRQAIEGAAADERVAVNAAFVKKFFDRIAPGLVDRFDGPAMLPLIAPRPMLVINGDSDPRSPLGGVREAIAAAERAYSSASARDRFEFRLEQDAAHEVTAAGREAAREWLVRWLSPSR